VNGQQVVLFQKYTSLSGGTFYLSEPVDMVRWNSGRISATLAGSTGTGNAVAQASESDDLNLWTELGTPQNMSATPITISLTNTARWLRLKITVPGTMPTATVWAVAILRDM